MFRKCQLKAHKPLTHTMQATYGEGRCKADLHVRSENESGGSYICKYGTRSKRTGSSYANLISHVRTAHPEYKELVNVEYSETQRKMQEFIGTTKAGNIYGWFDLIINRLLSFSIIENRLFRQHVEHKPISVSSFTKYLPQLAESVEAKIQLIVFSHFCDSLWRQNIILNRFSYCYRFFHSWKSQRLRTAVALHFKSWKRMPNRCGRAHTFLIVYAWIIKPLLR